MDIRLKELLHNLKDRNWDVNLAYKIDENEARKIVEAIESTEKKIADYTYTIGLLQDKLKDNGWILCSERLPRENVDVLVYDDSICNHYRVYTLVKRNNKLLWEDEYANLQNLKYVIAWQPLPEWKGEQG